MKHLFLSILLFTTDTEKESHEWLEPVSDEHYSRLNKSDI